MHGKQSVGSVRGESSHQEHPFIALLSENVTQDTGEVYGMHFVYSGNFLAQAELSQFDSIRMTMETGAGRKLCCTRSSNDLFFRGA